MTEGKFSDALARLTRMLLTIPLMVVETRKEVDEVGGLLMHEYDWVY